MINHLNKVYKDVYLHISEGPGGFKIEPGVLSHATFNPNHAILVSGDKPNLLWDLLHNLMGIPYPQLNTVEPPKKIKEEPPIKEAIIKEEIKSPLEMELDKMSSREIILKVAEEKGVAITLSPKSKKAIIKKAIEIYFNNPIDKQ